LADGEKARAGVQSSDTKLAFVVGYGAVFLVLGKTAVLGIAEEDCDRKAFERRAIFVGNLANDEAFRDEFEGEQIAIGQLNGTHGGRPGTGGVHAQVSRLVGQQCD
jgi:hypothetical protein